MKRHFATPIRVAQLANVRDKNHIQKEVRTLALFFSNAFRSRPPLVERVPRCEGLEASHADGQLSFSIFR